MTSLPLIEIKHITDTTFLQKVFQIRRKVFVEEQNVPENEEYDEYENTARHFLAFFANIPCGTARWRFTEKGVKLERFAVLKEFRGKGVGDRLVKAVLEDVYRHSDFNNQLIYLNAQLDAIPLYQKSGFQKVGGMFLECDIKHYQMHLVS
jgi:predicted GNAT family N-acyltransferase